MEHIYFNKEKGCLMLLDQRLLPHKEEWFECVGTQDIVYALQQMVVRGAPAIGVTAAFGCVLACNEVAARNDWKASLEKKLRDIAHARPTAANLAWAVEVMLHEQLKGQPESTDDLIKLWLDKAMDLHSKDIAINKRMGGYGAELINDGDTVMTHCNAGALATGGYGTALGVVRAAVDQGKKVKVIANETRPFLQGSRLTAYELEQDGIEVTVACDNACAHLMQQGLVDKVVVGADRIAANGDVANKIGTYGVALAASAHGVPFYVAAPLSTIDIRTKSGKDIPIEDRTPDEVKFINGKLILPENVGVYNFAFDITPSTLISAIITEYGILHKPYDEAINRVCA
ncbi:MAG: S-methyl-5-thioribose-1-phosphate isomerase [Desulfonatronovibrio sp. MSAO_Bac4]|nr:MAG: S-methyl-5-thioribose-1-phosphate isomerase [Desulfonatronovibrio sp. MSAO_Bac4]